MLDPHPEAVESKSVKVDGLGKLFSYLDLEEICEFVSAQPKALAFTPTRRSAFAEAIRGKPFCARRSPRPSCALATVRFFQAKLSQLRPKASSHRHAAMPLRQGASLASYELS